MVKPIWSNQFFVINKNIILNAVQKAYTIKKQNKTLQQKNTANLNHQNPAKPLHQKSKAVNQLLFLVLIMFSKKDVSFCLHLFPSLPSKTTLNANIFSYFCHSLLINRLQNAECQSSVFHTSASHLASLIRQTLVSSKL